MSQEWSRDDTIFSILTAASKGPALVYRRQVSFKHLYRRIRFHQISVCVKRSCMSSSKFQCRLPSVPFQSVGSRPGRAEGSEWTVRGAGETPLSSFPLDCHVFFVCQARPSWGINLFVFSQQGQYLAVGPKPSSTADCCVCKPCKCRQERMRHLILSWYRLNWIY